MKKRISSILLCLCMVITVLPTVSFAAGGACGADGSNVTWDLTGNTLTISGTGAMKDYVFATSPWYEDRAAIEAVEIESGVTSIGSFAFGNCDSLTNVTIPNSVTSIGAYAFAYCDNLHSMTIPDSVKIIETAAFWECRSLERVTIPYGISRITERLFDECTSLSEVIIPDSVTSIEKRAFNNCRKLKSITIPNGVTSIENETFYQCTDLNSITIPNSVTSIGAEAFSGCYSLNSITIPNSVTSIGRHAFFYNTSLRDVTIPNSVTSIGGYAFAWCENMTSITIPDSVKTIETAAFWKCTSLERVTMPCGISSITERLFDECRSLSEVIIPDSVTSIEERAFSNCTKLKSITIPNGVTSIGTEMFFQCINLNSITIPNSVTSIGNWAFYNCTSLSRIWFEGALPSIQSDSFVNVTANAYYPSSWSTVPTDGYAGTITWIAHDAHTPSGAGTVIKEPTYEDTGEISYTCSICGKTYTEAIPKLKSGDCSAAQDGSVIWKLNQAETVLTISGTGAMKDYDDGTAPWYGDRAAIEAVEIEAGVTSIGSFAFGNCDSLTNVTIPNSVTSIGAYAFAFCDNLHSMTIPNSVTSLGRFMFYYTDLRDIVLPNSITRIERNTFAYCSNLSGVIIPDSVTSIEDYAFAHCEKLNSIAIPKNVTSIGAYAFYYCGDLTVRFRGALPNINENAFHQTVGKAYYPSSWPRVPSATEYGGNITWIAHDKHTPSGAGTVTKEPTCTQTGEMLNTCSTCKDSYTEPIPKLAHVWDSGVVTKEPTMTENGEKTFTCSVGGETRTESIAKLPIRFFDVPDGEYYSEAVKWAIEQGITVGIGENQFAPFTGCTRAQIVTFLWRAMGSPEPTVYKYPFIDIDPAAYYYKAMLWAVEKGVAKGTTEMTFAPNAVCTRAQAMTLLWRAEGKPAAHVKNPFSDVQQGQWYTDAVLWAVENNITNGMTETTFEPNTRCNRAQIVTFLYRAMT